MSFLEIPALLTGFESREYIGESIKRTPWNLIEDKNTCAAFAE